MKKIFFSLILISFILGCTAISSDTNTGTSGTKATGSGVEITKFSADYPNLLEGDSTLFNVQIINNGDAIASGITAQLYNYGSLTGNEFAQTSDSELRTLEKEEFLFRTKAPEDIKLKTTISPYARVCYSYKTDSYQDILLTDGDWRGELPVLKSGSSKSPFTITITAQQPMRGLSDEKLIRFEVQKKPEGFASNGTDFTLDAPQGRMNYGDKDYIKSFQVQVPKLNYCSSGGCISFFPSRTFDDSMSLGGSTSLSSEGEPYLSGKSIKTQIKANEYGSFFSLSGNMDTLNLIDDTSPIYNLSFWVYVKDINANLSNYKTFSDIFPLKRVGIGNIQDEGQDTNGYRWSNVFPVSGEWKSGWNFVNLIATESNKIGTPLGDPNFILIQTKLSSLVYNEYIYFDGFSIYPLLSGDFICKDCSDDTNYYCCDLDLSNPEKAKLIGGEKANYRLYLKSNMQDSGTNEYTGRIKTALAYKYCEDTKEDYPITITLSPE